VPEDEPEESATTSGHRHGDRVKRRELMLPLGGAMTAAFAFPRSVRPRSCNIGRPRRLQGIESLKSPLLQQRVPSHRGPQSSG